jgi:hypothetical protein
MDAARPFPESTAGNKYVLVIQDVFTKFVEAIPLPRLSSVLIVQSLFSVWIKRYGPMRYLLTDNGSEFRNELLHKGLCDVCGVNKIFTTACHPQSNGVVERFMQTLKTLLTAHMMMLSSSKDWDLSLDFVTFAYNQSMHSETREIPYYLWFGRPPTALHQLISLPEDDRITMNTHEYRDTLWKTLVDAFQLVRDEQLRHQTQSDIQRAKRVTTESWIPGKLVWVHRPNLSSILRSKKLVNLWDGPAQILRVLTPERIAVLLPTRTDPRREMTVHPDRLRQYTFRLYNRGFNRVNLTVFHFNSCQRGNDTAMFNIVFDG